MSETNCVIGNKPHTADIGYLCRHHLEDLGRILRDIEDEAVHLSAVPSMQQSSGSRGGTLASHRAPVRLDVVVANDPRRGGGWSEDEDERLAAGELLSVLNTLHGWARVVREDRGLAPPERVTVTGERDTLSRNLDWIAGQGWVDDAYRDFRKLLGQLKGSNGTTADKPIGRCWHPNGDEECGGSIRRSNLTSRPWAALADRCVQVDVDTAEGHAYCERCGCTWDGAEVHRLMLVMKQREAEARRPRTEDGRPMRTAAELASDLGLRLTAVRMRLSRVEAKAAHGGYYDPAVLGVPRHAVEAS